MTLNMGPQHPSTHGVLRILLELEGETIIKGAPGNRVSAYGDREGVRSEEVSAGGPLTDRVDYLANLSNNLCYALAVEKLLGTGNSGNGSVDARDAGANCQRSPAIWSGWARMRWTSAR